MGKSKKLKSNAGNVVVGPVLPLHEQIERSKIEKGRDVARVKQRSIKRSRPAEEYIDGSLSNKILKTAWKQRQAEEAVEGEENSTEENKLERVRQVSLGNVSMLSVSDDDHISDNDDYDDTVLQINPEDEAAIEKFMSKPNTATRTLFDIISEKIEQKKSEIDFQLVNADDDFVIKNIDPEVVKMYREIGVILSHYRSGKIPKAFKILPRMMNWEQLLYLTNPDKWSAAAMYQATRIFASNLHAKMCQRFYNLVLLPRLRDDIVEYKKLNFHLFQALQKAIYKPQAFFKGILLPLCESGTCTLREATIFGSVLTKASIPMLHAAVAMLKIANMEYTGSNSLFLRILIDKKYTLPYRAIDALVNHFLRFRKEERQLPVLWHQSLLALVQRYKNDMSDEQRNALLGLTKVQHHYQITPEVRRELLSVAIKENNEGKSDMVMEC